MSNSWNCSKKKHNSSWRRWLEQTAGCAGLGDQKERVAGGREQWVQLQGRKDVSLRSTFPTVVQPEKEMKNHCKTILRKLVTLFAPGRGTGSLERRVQEVFIHICIFGIVLSCTKIFILINYVSSLNKSSGELP